MARALALIGLLCTLPSPAEETIAEFERARRGATQVTGGLSAFLERFIGECAEAMDSSCREQAKRFREQMQGRKLYFSASDESAALLAPGPENRGSDAFSLDLTPFFPAGGYALSQGTPRKMDAQGNPLLSVLQLPVTLPEDRTWSEIRRMVSAHSVRVQVVATPRSIWILPKKGGGKWFGVAADLDAVLVTEGRTGDLISLWLARR